MQQIDLTIQPVGYEFRVEEGVPCDCAESDLVVFVTFIYKRIQFTAWIPRMQQFTDYHSICRQLIRTAKMRASTAMLESRD